VAQTAGPGAGSLLITQYAEHLQMVARVSGEKVSEGEVNEVAQKVEQWIEGLPPQSAYVSFRFLLICRQDLIHSELPLFFFSSLPECMYADTCLSQIEPIRLSLESIYRARATREDLAQAMEDRTAAVRYSDRLEEDKRTFEMVEQSLLAQNDETKQYVAVSIDHDATDI
jgi:hypothetical protein